MAPLSGEPAAGMVMCECLCTQMQRLFTDMDDSERLLPLQVGLDPTGSGSAFVARNLVMHRFLQGAVSHDSCLFYPRLPGILLPSCSLSLAQANDERSTPRHDRICTMH